MESIEQHKHVDRDSGMHAYIIPIYNVYEDTVKHVYWDYPHIEYNCAIGMVNGFIQYAKHRNDYFSKIILYPKELGQMPEIIDDEQVSQYWLKPEQKRYDVLMPESDENGFDRKWMNVRHGEGYRWIKGHNPKCTVSQTFIGNRHVIVRTNDAEHALSFHTVLVFDRKTKDFFTIDGLAADVIDHIKSVEYSGD